MESPAGAFSCQREVAVAPSATVHHGEALAWLATLDTASVDAIVTDPPYS